MSVRIEQDGGVWTVVLDRPEVRNAVDAEHAEQLLHAFEAFDEDDDARVAVLWALGARSAPALTCAPSPTAPSVRGLPARAHPAWARLVWR
jgi:hypothetical protein